MTTTQTTPHDWKRLRELAEGVETWQETNWFDEEQLFQDGGFTRRDAAYIAAANPKAILALLEERERLMLSGHQCEPVARMLMEEPRDWWLGRLLKPIPDYPRETHCLHIRTPLKSVVLGMCAADFDQLAVIGYIATGERHANQEWVERVARTLTARAALSGPATEEAK